MPSVRFFAESNEAAIVFSKFCASCTLAWSFRRRSSSNSLSLCACFSRNFSISSAIICSLLPGAGAFGINDASAAAGTGPHGRCCRRLPVLWTEETRTGGTSSVWLQPLNGGAHHADRHAGVQGSPRDFDTYYRYGFYIIGNGVKL